MRIVSYNWESLSRHGITIEMIDEVLLGSMISYFDVNDADNTCCMAVGYTLSEKLIEIGIRFLPAKTVYIFHAQTASPKYRKLFYEEWDNA